MITQEEEAREVEIEKLIDLGFNEEEAEDIVKGLEAEAKEVE